MRKLTSTLLWLSILQRKYVTVNCPSGRGKPEQDDLSSTDICDTLYVQPDAAILVWQYTTQEWFPLWPTVSCTKRPI